MYVKYLVKKNPGVPLKKLITGYDKNEYERFKKNPKLFVWFFCVLKLNNAESESRQNFQGQENSDQRKPGQFRGPVQEPQ